MVPAGMESIEVELFHLAAVPGHVSKRVQEGASVSVCGMYGQPLDVLEELGKEVEEEDGWDGKREREFDLEDWEEEEGDLEVREKSNDPRGMAAEAVYAIGQAGADYSDSCDRLDCIRPSEFKRSIRPNELLPPNRVGRTGE